MTDTDKIKNMLQQGASPQAVTAAQVDKVKAKVTSTQEANQQPQPSPSPQPQPQPTPQSTPSPEVNQNPEFSNPGDDDLIIGLDGFAQEPGADPLDAGPKFVSTAEFYQSFCGLFQMMHMGIASQTGITLDALAVENNPGTRGASDALYRICERVHFLRPIISEETGLARDAFTVLMFGGTIAYAASAEFQAKRPSLPPVLNAETDATPSPPPGPDASPAAPTSPQFSL
ncbi:MAG: hypothetical protein AAFW83_10365 [Pseudomonadota bacterium]